MPVLKAQAFSPEEYSEIELIYGLLICFLFVFIMWRHKLEKTAAVSSMG